MLRKTCRKQNWQNKPLEMFYKNNRNSTIVLQIFVLEWLLCYQVYYIYSLLVCSRKFQKANVTWNYIVQKPSEDDEDL